MAFKTCMIGSCLSASTLKVLLEKADIALTNRFTHLRSDVIREVLKGEAIGAPAAEVPTLEALLAPRLEGEQKQKMLSTRLKAQTSQTFAQVRDEIATADVLLLDTNYDFGRMRHEVTLDGKTYRFSNLLAEAAEDVTVTPAMTPDEIPASVEALIEAIQALNPDLRIFFINYPYSAFANRGRGPDLKRVDGVRRLGAALRARAEAGTLPRGLTVLDCTELADHLLTTKGPLYFDDAVYDTFAELIVRKLDPEGGIEESYFGDFDALRDKLGLAPVRPPASHSPYADLPDRQYWKPAVAEPYPLAITDLYRKRFDIGADTRVATCGSCFAQHIGKRLNRRGYAYMDVEPAPRGMSGAEASALGYGIYSARYGNVYTSRQLLQLFHRAFGNQQFDELWQNSDGRYIDPFRPNLCGSGETDAGVVRTEQAAHLARVRQMFENLDVFVFTMGLTETWANRQTGAVYPICPGVTAGRFDPTQHEFLNLDYATILDEMEKFLTALADVNPKARVLLTVSPVPLTATAEDRHVLVSTMASKAILRAVADALYHRHGHVDYFPSYDIVMSPPYRSMFFKNNLRSIHEEGVDHVMSHFFAQHGLAGPVPETPATDPEDDEAFCDEAFLELARTAKAGATRS